MKPFTFETSCVDSTALHINNMRDHPQHREVSYQTMLRNCDGLLMWAKSKGYDPRVNVGSGITLRDDPYVAYYKSVYRGQPCYYLVWSAIEWIWTQDRCDPTKGNCYSVHMDFLANMKINNPDRLVNWQLCHGEVEHSKMKGFRYGHCWLERLGKEEQTIGRFPFPREMFTTVVDLSNGNSEHNQFPATFYYFAGQIKTHEVIRYTPAEAFRKLCETGEYGPWHEGA